MLQSEGDVFCSTVLTLCKIYLNVPFPLADDFFCSGSLAGKNVNGEFKVKASL